ncbi:MAG: hypothetical protein CME06_13930 [Gemmatimonadetes bacterium]|nr:hypothetical protein [Gemmatimonadota bacterium]
MRSLRISTLLLLCSAACDRIDPVPLDDRSAAAEPLICFELLDAGRSGIDGIYTWGVAINDFDRDGDQDIFFATRKPNVRGPEMARRDLLYRNDGDLTFSRIGGRRGIRRRSMAQGAVWGDLNGDGFDDLYVTTLRGSPNRLYYNNGDGTFVEAAKRAGVGSLVFGKGASLADVDADGRLDIYVANALVGRDGREGYRGIPNQLFVNRGERRFVDMASAIGVEGLDRGEGYNGGFSDLNNDGIPDLLVTNDYREDQLFVSDRDEKGGAAIAFRRRHVLTHRSGAMGVAFGDYDNDGDFDFYLTNYNPDILFDNVNGTMFNDVSRASGIHEYTRDVVGMGAAFADLDNDGDLDLCVSNGQVDSIEPQRNAIFENLGEGCFADITPSAGPGLADFRHSQGLAVGDLDNDGRVDVVVGNDDGSAPSILINRTADVGGWVRLLLVGRAPNTSAIGARVSLSSGDLTQVRERRAGTSYLSCNENVLHFGLGDYDGTSRARIRWPDGSVSEEGGLKPRSTVTIVQPDLAE